MQFTLPRSGERAGQQLDAVRRFGEYLFGVARMLLGQYFSRHHQRGLMVVLHGGQHGNHGHYRFAAADVTLQQTIHGPQGFHVAKDFFGDYPALRRSKFERQNGRDTLFDRLVNFNSGAFALFDPISPFRGQAQHQPE